MKIFTLIAHLLLASAGLCQTVELENNGQEATGFITVHGLFTSDHVSEQHATIRFSDRDIRVDRTQSSKYGFRFGTGRPSFFYDRRNHKVKVSVVDIRDKFYIVDVRFYSGESGTPVFDRLRRVVGVVSGNDRSTDPSNRWLGRVSIFGKTESDSYFRLTVAK